MIRGDVLIGLMGFFAGTVFVGAVGRWVAVIWEVARKEQEDGSRRFSLPMAAAVSAFHAGPWSILVVGFLAYQLAAEPWWSWFFGGGLVGVALFSVLIAMAVGRFRNGRPFNTIAKTHENSNRSAR